MVLTDEQQFALPPKGISTSKHQESQSVNTMKQPSTRRLFSYKLVKTACAGCKKSRKAQRHETMFRLAKKQQRKQTSRIRESNLITRNNEAAVDKTAVLIQADKNGLRRAEKKPQGAATRNSVSFRKKQQRKQTSRVSAKRKDGICIAFSTSFPTATAACTATSISTISWCKTASVAL